MSWSTRLTRHFPCRIPILSAPMAGHTSPALAAETARAGGLGFLAAGHFTSLDAMEQEIAEFEELCRSHNDHDDHHQSNNTNNNNNHSNNKPLCIGFIGHSSLRDAAGWDRYETLLHRHRPAVVQFFAPGVLHHDNAAMHTNNNNIRMAQQVAGAQVLVQVGTYAEAVEAAAAGADGLILQGSEAGGHGVRRELGNGTLSLAATVVDRLLPQYDNSHNSKKLTLIAAGGIVNASTLVAALALGCHGVVLGTRLWASRESRGPAAIKQALVDAASCDDVVRTTVLDQIQNTYTPTPWPYPYDSCGVLQNDTTRQWDGRAADALADELQQQPPWVDDYRRRGPSDPAIGMVHAGQGVGMIDSVEDGTYDIVDRISREALALLQGLPEKLIH